VGIDAVEQGLLRGDERLPPPQARGRALLVAHEREEDFRGFKSAPDQLLCRGQQRDCSVDLSVHRRYQ
jgi:hypothetical protein